RASATPSAPMPPAARSPSVPARPVAKPTIPSPAAPLDPQAPRTALELSAPDSLPGSGIAAASLLPRALGDREVHPALQPRPQRFRRKAGMTPEQTVHGIFQLIGAWPPGYTGDQCRLARQQID